MIKKNKKKFDCVQMKRDIQEKIWVELKPLSTEDYFNKLESRIAKSKDWAEFKRRSGKIL